MLWLFEKLHPLCSFCVALDSVGFCIHFCVESLSSFDIGSVYVAMDMSGACVGHGLFL